MDSDTDSSGQGAQGAGRLRDSVSTAIRQMQSTAQRSRVQPQEIPESDDDEVEHPGVKSEAHEEDNQSDDDFEVGEEKADSDGSHEPPPRRHSASSAGSHYSPSTTSSEGGPRFVKAELPRQNELPLRLSTPSLQDRKPRYSPQSTIPPTPAHFASRWSSPLKRSRSPSPSHTPLAKIPTAPASQPPPFKRPRTTPLNHAYLALLNEDIRDAATRFTPHPSLATDQLPPSQLGLTHWSAAEKALFFEALARLGRDDVAGIARRVRTKGAAEVSAYLALLRDAATAQARQEKGRESVRVGVVDMPAAVELSQACCAALEEAADAVSVRQEVHEEAEERKRWGGGGRWLIGVGNVGKLVGKPPEGMPSIRVFRVRNWLRLSERVFMNSAVEEYNWAGVDGDRPSVRATALEDFYTLAVEITRRLVAATVFVAESRVKARKELYPTARSRVWKQDVEAAALSLGLPTNSHKFWAKCARRLRLDVYDDEDEDVGGWDGEEGQDPMSFDDVETALGLEVEAGEGDAAPDEGTESSEDENMKDEIASVAGSDHGSVELGAGTPYASEYEELPPEQDEAEKEAVGRELNEVLVHSALEYPTSSKARDTLRKRVRAERAHEAHADRLDARASYYEEKRLWAMLERQPPVELIKVDVPDEPPKCTKRTVDDLIRGFARTPGDWRSKLEVVPSRWEMEYALVEEEKREKAKAAAAADDSDNKWYPASYSRIPEDP